MADIRKEQEDGRARVTITGDVTVQHAQDVASALSEAVLAADVVEIVIDRVTAADVTFPQTICAAHRTGASLKKEVLLRGQSEEPVGTLLYAAGFPRHIGCQDKTGKTCLWLVAERGGRKRS